MNLFSWKVCYYGNVHGSKIYEYEISHIALQNSFLQDRNGNCQPGTTIDEEVCHPTLFDYYQYGHAGIQVFDLVIIFQCFQM